MVGFYPVIKVKKFNEYFTPPKNKKVISIDYEWGRHKKSRAKEFHSEKQAQTYGLDNIKPGYSILILQVGNSYRIYTKINSHGKWLRKYDKGKYKNFTVDGERIRFHSEGYGTQEYMKGVAKRWKGNGYRIRIDKQSGYGSKYIYRLYVAKIFKKKG
jgi:hypothetical protein